MATKRGSTSRLVYSTDKGRIDADRQSASTDRGSLGSEGGSSGDGIVRLRRETKGRGGKAVTVVTGLPGDSAALKARAKVLKQRCGVGGAVKDGAIEIQGDQRQTIKAVLEDEGFTVKLAGG